MLSIMFVARPACCVNYWLFTASAGAWLNLQQQEANVSLLFRPSDCLEIQVHLNKLECRGKVHLFQ